MKKIRCLILDLDGTIADTLFSLWEAVNMALEKNGLPGRSEEEIRQAIGNGGRMLIRRSIPAHLAKDETFVSQVLSDFAEMYDKTYDHLSGCYAGMAEALRSLHQRGYRLAVLSNKADRYVKRIIDLLFPDGIFSVVMGQTDLPKKPDPTVPLMILEQLGIAPEEAAFVGDSDVDVETGKNAGMLTVGCAWGYRGREELMGADHVIDSAWELAELFV